MRYLMPFFISTRIWYGIGGLKDLEEKGVRK